MSVLVTFNSTGYLVPTANETGWATNVSNLLIDLGNNTLTKVNTLILSGAVNATVGATTPNSGAFTSLSASGAVSGTGFTTLLASPSAIGSSTPSSGAFTTLSATGAVSGAGYNAMLASPPAIGGTAPAVGTFTTLTGTGVVQSKGASGSCSLNSDGTGRGYLAWYNASAVNQGYIGYLNGTSIDLVGTGSATTINLFATNVALNATTTTTAGALVVGTSLTLGTGQGFYLKDTGGTAHLAQNVDASNYHNLCLVNAGAKVRILNAALTTELFGVDNSGHTNVAGALAVTGAISGAAITAGGVVTANAGLNTTTLGASGLITASGGVSSTTLGASGLITANGGINTTSVTASAAITGGSLISNANVQAGIGGSGGGYVCKQGVLGAFSGNTTNLFYTAGVTQLWVDNTNLGNITVSSDARFKHHIKPLDSGALDRIDRLKPVTYRWQDRGLFTDDGEPRAGLLAQEVRAVIPSAVSGIEDEQHVLSMNPLPLIATLIAAVQELRAEVDDLKSRL